MLRCSISVLLLATCASPVTDGVGTAAAAGGVAVADLEVLVEVGVVAGEQATHQSDGVGGPSGVGAQIVELELHQRLVVVERGRPGVRRSYRNGFTKG